MTEDAASLLVAFGEDFIEPIKEFTNDETLETFVRSAAASALAALGKNIKNAAWARRNHKNYGKVL